VKVSLTIALALGLVLALRAEVWVLQPPLGLDLYMPVPEGNPITREKVARGRQLFFDKQLSRDGTLACASCHDPKRAFSDGRAVARGVDGAEGRRNAPALLNRGYGGAFFWDGRVESLERQALEPIFNPIELGLTQTELERRTGMKATDVSAALASYVRTIRSADSAFDRYAAGKSRTLDSQEKAGLTLFRGKGHCVECHPTSNFTDEEFHNTGVAWHDGRLIDEGRSAVSNNPKDRGAFKTPTLREVARTGPYMHDGSLVTLEDVVDFYSKGGRPNPNLDPRIRPRDFTPQEKRALIAFLRSLTGHIREGMP
jgi:cytochrome c peroxidase